MFLTPTAFTSQSWETYTVYLEAVGDDRRHGLRFRLPAEEQAARPIAHELPRALHSCERRHDGGFLWWLVSGVTSLLALSLAVETVVYFDAVLTATMPGRALPAEIMAA